MHECTFKFAKKFSNIFLETQERDYKSIHKDTTYRSICSFRLTDKHNIAIFINDIANTRIHLCLQTFGLEFVTEIVNKIHTQRLEKCVDLTVLYGSITPKTPNGTFCALPVVFSLTLLDVLFIQIPVVITKYIWVISVFPVVDVVEPVVVSN